MLLETIATPTTKHVPPPIPTSLVLGLPLSRLSYTETLKRIEWLLNHGQPSFFITAPLNYAMLTNANEQLKEANRKAAFLVADGMPLVWLSKMKGSPIVQRVAGSDLVYSICELCRERGDSVYLLGAAPGVAAKAAQTLRSTYPGLLIAGTACPSMSQMSIEEEAAIINTIRDSGAAVLFFARGQPAGEIWLSENFQKLGCLSVQVGASLDFIAHGVPRAPLWMQRTGTEWIYRLLQEPRRLANRYWRNATFFFLHAPLDVLLYRRTEAK
jgi:N-acetylglucosaminyldiphosphoundecaprenol N-acetyl-beta-D-mannosaminyltransferase